MIRACSLSASGARIRGDDYQHLFAWIQVLRAVQAQSGVTEIGLEDPEAGNADDVTVYKEDQDREFFQVKSSVTAQETIDVGWLTKPSRRSGPSILQRFYNVWSSAPVGHRPKLTLVTNRLPASDDPVLILRDGRDGTVVQRLWHEKPKSRAGLARKTLAAHLKITEEELLDFLSDLRFIAGRLYDEWKKQATEMMFAVGLRYDEDSLVLGMSIVREWVESGKRRLTLAELREAVEPLSRLGELPDASLLVQAIDRDPMPENALVALDWMESFPGDEPRTRRQSSSGSLWNSRFRPELQKAAQDLRARGCSNVLVRGHMRLPTWFAVGVELGKTAGFQVVSFQGGEPWSSEGALSEFPIETLVEELNDGEDLAVGIALASDLSEDVLRYLQSSGSQMGWYTCIRPQRGATNHAIRCAAEARDWAYETRDAVRRIVREYKPARVHLFLATPHSAALLLGHLWDRMPSTQLYEDLGPSVGYAPSFLIPN